MDTRGSSTPGCFLSEGSMLYFNINNPSSASASACRSTKKCLCTLVCPPGTYQDQTWQSSCKPCASGYYQDQARQPLCKECGTGKYNDLTTQTSESVACKNDCNAGSYINFDKSACLNCIEGQYQDQDGQSNCKKCGTGKYNDQTSQTSKSSCKECSAGSYITSGNSACKTYPTCLNTQGTTPNTPAYGNSPAGDAEDPKVISCSCGTTTCTKTLGLYCTVKLYLCTKGPSACGTSIVETFHPEKCQVVTERCECSQCISGYHTANCTPCKFF